MIIRNEQIETFQQNLTERFVREVIQVLKEDHKEAIAGMSDDVLEKRVKSGIEKGEIYGFTRKSDLLIFVTLMFEIAPCFSEYPSINDILKNESIKSEEKTYLLLNYVPECEWAQAKAHHKEADWELL